MVFSMRSCALLASVSYAARRILPDVAVASSADSGVSSSLLNGFECASPDLLLGYYDDEDICARAVENANGKWFSFSPETRECKLEYTSSGTCPEGFLDSIGNADPFKFYDSPLVPKADAQACALNVVEVSVPSGTGVLVKSQCGETLVKADYLEEKGNEICSQEYRLGTFGGKAVVDKWEACCSDRRRRRRRRTPGCGDDEKTFVSREPLSDSWSLCRQPEYVTFEVVARAQPALTWNIATDSCVKAKLQSDTVTLESMFLSCAFPASTVQGIFSQVSFSTLDPEVFDAFTNSQFNAGIGALTQISGSYDDASERIPVPTTNQKFVDRYSTNGLIGMPSNDVDRVDGNRWDDQVLRCLMNFSRRLAIEDSLGGSDPWVHLLGDKAHQDSAKKNWVRTLFQGPVTASGDPVYPEEVMNFADRWLVNGVWKDEGETWLGWTHWGSHRVEPVSMTGASFVVRSNALAGLKVRPGFARAGADMYFDVSGTPVMIETPDGQKLWRKDVETDTWQHWKFVWRSSVVLYVTVIDHLWATHMGASNTLAGATREALPAAHPLRRLLSMFTYNAIGVNHAALDSLIASENILHRSSPFLDFYEVDQASRALIPSLKARFGQFVDASVKASLPEQIQSIPFVYDGQLLFDALRKLVRDFFGVYSEWCSNGAVVDPDVSFFFDRMTTWSMYAEDHLQTDAQFVKLFGTDGETLTCDGFQTYLTIHLFHVSGYHRHVGQVFDALADPDWSGWAWKENAAYADPQQSVLAMLVTAATGTRWPKISEEYEFMMQGIAKSSQAIKVLQDFRSELSGVGAEIDRRNKDRPIEYRLQHPADVEVAVSV